MRGENNEDNKTIFIGYLDAWTTGPTTRDLSAYKLILVSCLVLSDHVLNERELWRIRSWRHEDGTEGGGKAKQFWTWDHDVESGSASNAATLPCGAVYLI